MTTTVAPTDVERFRSVVARRLGLRLDDTKLELLDNVLRSRLDATRHDVDRYLHIVEHDRVNSELAALATGLTVPETYFFRNIDQFHACAEVAVPERVKARGATGTLRVLSAGCASGEEPYTLAIVLRDALRPGWDASVLGVDLNPVVLRKARRGRYSRWSLRETPSDVEARWFTSDARDVVLDDEIRAAVTFEPHNLADENPALWAKSTYDIVFCRNVIMYFTPEVARAVVARIARALAPGGFLFLGHAETLRGLSHDFDLCHTHGTFYYQRKLTDSDCTASTPDVQMQPTDASAVLAAEAWEADTWVETIRSASERVARLVNRKPGRPPADLGSSDEPRDANRWNLGTALELLRAERFGDALGLLDALPVGAEVDPDVVLLRSVLLTHAGRVADAEATSHRLLTIDGLSAGAHYVLALCHETRGDLAGASDHDRTAAYLDPSFAMPRVHLGLLARRAGDNAATTRELAHAVTLLEREDASRLLLFGGGFSRATLVALCRAELGTGTARS